MFLGIKQDGTNLELDEKTLTTHVAVLGSTGSGKSGLILTMVEELQTKEIPVILLDIKGDMVNIALQENYNQVHYISPGGVHGEPVNILADLGHTKNRQDLVSALLSMIGESPDPIKSSAHMFLSEVLKWSGKHPTVVDIIENCIDPPFDHLGALDTDSAFSSRNRGNLARKLNALLMSESFQNWTMGGKLDIESLVNSNNVTIYSVAHLFNRDEQVFAISLLMTELVKWMKKQQGSSEPRVIVAIDECVGLLPPYPLNPPTKGPILTLLKQSRAFGMGIVLGTQNPVDIDYKALSNCNTWFVGRMTANKDRAKVSSAMASLGKASENTLSRLIAGLKPRNFLLSNKDGIDIFKTRDAKSDLAGPMNSQEVFELFKEGFLSFRKDRSPKKLQEKILPFPKEEKVEPDSFYFTESFFGLILLGLYGYFFINVLFEKAVTWLR